MIVLMAGLPGAGKTTLALELARRTSGTVLSKDEFRHSLFRPDEIEYSTRQDDFVQDLMLNTAGYILSRAPEKFIFLDGRPFSRRYQIENVIAAANSLHQSWQIFECVCAEETIRQRLKADSQSGNHPARDRNYSLYLDVLARFEVIVHPKIVIDMEQSLSRCVEMAVAALQISIPNS
jgi:predicted kinase